MSHASWFRCASRDSGVTSCSGYPEKSSLWAPSLITWPKGPRYTLPGDQRVRVLKQFSNQRHDHGWLWNHLDTIKERINLFPQPIFHHISTNVVIRHHTQHLLYDRLEPCITHDEVIERGRKEVLTRLPPTSEQCYQAISIRIRQRRASQVP